MGLLRKTKKLHVAILAGATALCVVGGTMALSKTQFIASATTTSVPVSNIISVNGATATVQTNTATAYKATQPYSYKGITIDSDTAYTGEFNGVFKGDMTLKYKFPGASHGTAYTGDGLGDFYFYIQSVAEPSQWIKLNYTQRTSNGNRRYDASVLYATRSSYGADYATRVKPNTTGGVCEYQKISSAKAVYTTGSMFNADAYAEPEALYFEIEDTNSDGVEDFNISYQILEQNTNGTYTYNQKSVPLVVCDGSNSTWKAAFDISQGYTISFGSNFDNTQDFYQTNGTTKYTGELPDAGTKVCFISMNEDKFEAENLAVTCLDSAIANENTYEKNGKTYINIDEGKTLEDIQFKNKQSCKFSATEFYFDYYSDAEISIDDTGIDWTKTGAGEAGKALLSGGGIVDQELYVKIGKTISENDYDVLLSNLDDNATAEKVEKASNEKVANAYEGLMVSSSEAYEGSFDGIFVGSTSIRYKFPGQSKVKIYSPLTGTAAKDPTSELVLNPNAYGKGDALGDFYFLVESIANPMQSFEIHISSLGNGRSVRTAIYAKAQNVAGATMYYTKQTANNNSAICVSSADSAKLIGCGPLFNSDNNDALGDFAENLYFDIDEDGIMSVYYDQRDSSFYTQPAPKNLGKYGASEWNNAPLIRFDSAPEGFYNQKDGKAPNTYGAVFDASQGYKISFGSNFDMNKTYYEETWNFETGARDWVAIDNLSAYGVDGGTDVCFLSVGGLDLTKENVFLTANTQVTYNGEFQGEQDGKSVVYLMEGATALPSSHTIHYTYGYTDSWLLEQEFQERILTADEILGEDFNEISLQQVSAVLTSNLTNIRPYIYEFYCQTENANVITLQTNGGELQDGVTEIIYSQSMIPVLPDANWHEVVFLGWYKEPDFRTKVEVITIDLGSTTLYAKWKDDFAPIIRLNNKPTFEAVVIGTQNIIQATDVWATDNVDGNIAPENIQITVKVPLSDQYINLADISFTTIGEYVIKYKVTDSAGFSDEVERIVSIVEYRAPVITVNGEIVSSAYTNKNIIIPSATATEDATVSINVFCNGIAYVIDDGSFIAEQAGTYKVCYYAKTANQVTSLLEYEINVIEDVEAPVLALDYEVMEVLIRSTVKIPQFTAFDNADGEILPTIKVMYGTKEISIVDNQFVVGELGAYTIYYTVEDSAGNKNEKNIIVYAREDANGADSNTPEQPSDFADWMKRYGWIVGVSVGVVGVGCACLFILRKKKK